MCRKVFLYAVFCLNLVLVDAQIKSSDNGAIAITPPMGWMSWNYFGDNLHEKDIYETADAMVNSGLLDAGFQYIFIDDGWQGGRDNRNNIIPDVKKFPSGIKALADYVHSKGLKLGIYSDAAPLTCAGYTGSLNFEEQDAKTFASWGIDYLKYDYCGAPSDSISAKMRYKAVSEALRHSGRDITLGICEWGQRQPWKWAASVGGRVWRTTADIRDKWKNIGSEGYGILDIINDNAVLNQYAGRGRWNDMDMLVVGLYGQKGPSSDLGGIGCSDIEYQTQMSIWCMMASPLAVSCDVRHMSDVTKRILLNKEIIALNQDALGIQCERKINTKTWDVFIKPLADGDCAIAILNHSDEQSNFSLTFSEVGLFGKYKIRDLWAHKIVGKGNKWKGRIAAHETKVFRLKKINE